MNDTPLPVLMAEIAALLERKRTAQAKARLKVALQSHPNHPELLLQAAWADYLDNDNAAALATVRQVLLQDPENQSARLLLFELHVENNRLSDAEQVIVQLLRDYPEHGPYYGRYAELMIRATSLPKARALAQEGLKYDPDSAGCLSALTLCDFIEQRHGATSHALQQLLLRHPQSLRTLTLILVALHHRGDDREALRIAQELVRAQPDNPDFVRLAMELKASTHWSMLPLWPLRRWGWGGSIALWVFGVVGVRMIGRDYPAIAGLLAFCILGYAIYSWVWPPLLRRWIARA